VSQFNFHGHVRAEHLIQGDHNQVVIGSAAVGELARTVEANAGAVRQIEATLAELQAELASNHPRQDRLRQLLATLGSGAGALTAMVDGIEKVRQAVGR
jgi:hypothetical protein